MTARVTPALILTEAANMMSYFRNRDEKKTWLVKIHGLNHLKAFEKPVLGNMGAR